jgi:hypothetical protein
LDGNGQVCSRSHPIHRRIGEIGPFVLQTSLNDFHISWGLNAFVPDPPHLPGNPSTVTKPVEKEQPPGDAGNGFS